MLRGLARTAAARLRVFESLGWWGLLRSRGGTEIMSVKLSSTTAADPTLERGGAEQSLPFSPGIVYTTVANMEEAKTLAKELLQAKMAACVQMKGVISAYVWKDEVHEDPEVQLTLKVNLANYDTLEQFIKKHHKYDTPQIVGTPITHGSEEFLDWVREGTKAAMPSASVQQAENNSSIDQQSP